MRKDGTVWKELLHENLRWTKTESRAIALSKSMDDPARGTEKNWPESRKEKRKIDKHNGQSVDCGSKVKFTQGWLLCQKQINIELTATETFAD